MINQDKPNANRFGLIADSRKLFGSSPRLSRAFQGFPGLGWFCGELHEIAHPSKILE